MNREREARQARGGPGSWAHLSDRSEPRSPGGTRDQSRVRLTAGWAGALSCAAVLALSTPHPVAAEPYGPNDTIDGAALIGDIDEAAVARLEQLLEATDTLRARFEQQVTDSAGRLLEQSTGQVEIARPGRLRWAYEHPYEQLLITDGQHVWMYDVDLEQVSISRVQQSIADSPAMLLGGGRLRDSFDITGTAQHDKLSWVWLVPRAADSDFRSIVLAHDGDVVHYMELTDALGQITHIRFDEVERGVDLPDERFSFEPPPGVDVIGRDGP